MHFAQKKCANSPVGHLSAHAPLTKTSTKKTHTLFACSSDVQKQKKQTNNGKFAAPLMCIADIGTVFE
jgi:hypothetical protein